MKLQITVFGQFEVSFNDQRVPLKSKKGEALLAYVALSPRGVVRRDSLKALLWRDSEEKKAQNNLRQAVWAIAKALEKVGYSGFESNRSQITLDLESISVDAVELLNTVATGNPDTLLITNPHVFDSVLEGCEDISNEFGQWLSSLSARFRASLLRELGNSLQTETPDQHTLQAAAVLHALEPLNEIACQVLMQSKAASGDTAAALTVYQHLCREMDEQQGMEPSEKTQDLAVAIKNGTFSPNRHAAEGPHTGLGNSGRPCIVLSDIEIAGANAQQLRLINGFRHEFLASLIQFKEWQIVDGRRHTTTATTDTNGIPRSYSLEMSAIAIEQSLRIILTLKETNTDNYIWGDKIEDRLENYLSSQADIIRRLAAALNIRVSADRLALFGTQKIHPLDAFDRWLVAEELILSMEQPAWLRAEYLLTDLIADYESFARAHSALAQMENSRQLSFPGAMSSEDRREIALIHARRSVALDPNDSRNQLCLGWARAMDGQYAGAEVAYLKAHQLNENDPWTLISSAMGLAFCGNQQQASRLSKEAALLTTDPSNLYWSFQAAIAFLDNDMDGCIRLSKLCDEVTADVLAWHTAALALSGHITAASTLNKRFVEVTRELWQRDPRPTDKNIAQWLLTSFPIREPKKWQSLRDGLKIAGLDVSGVHPPLQ